MKELHDLMEYIDEYEYDWDKGRISIRKGSNEKEALKLYCRAYFKLSGKEIQSPYSDYSEEHKDKWLLDIAIDCIRTMSDKTRSYIRRHPWASDYHFSTAMYIRNTYLSGVFYRRLYDFGGGYQKDSVSGRIMNIIIGIINPAYGPYKKCFEWYGDFLGRPHKIYREYADSEWDIFEEIENEYFNDDSKTLADEAYCLLLNRLKERLGYKEFEKIFREFVKDCFKSKEEIEDWNIEGINNYVFQTECNQLLCLHRMGVLEKVASWEIRSLKELREYISKEIGFKDEYTEPLAKCVWKVLNPTRTRRWKKLDVIQCDIQRIMNDDERKRYVLRSRGTLYIRNDSISTELKKHGINTMGDVYNRSLEDIIKQCPELDSDDVKIILSWFEEAKIKWPKEEMDDDTLSAIISSAKKPIHISAFLE